MPKKLTIELMHQIAKERGGKCLSDVYVNNRTKLKWECDAGHIFKREYDVIQRGWWCNTCSISIGEKITKLYFETIFNKPFNKVRPDWLRNEKGNKLELDGYNEELKIAFEHQGAQHYKISTKFGKETTETAKKHDEIKRRKCFDKGVVLIEIPEVGKIIKLKELYPYIIRRFQDYGIDVSGREKEINQFNINEIFKNSNFEKIKKKALKNEGKFISGDFLTLRSKLTFSCSKGHIWIASGERILNGSWCKQCRNKESGLKRKIDIEELKKIAINKGGICLSTCNDKRYLQWQCKKGHIWKSTGQNIKQGRWCKECAGLKRKTMDDMHKLANLKEGVCLSRKYINNRSKLTWKCKNSHIFEMTPSHVQQNHWCPKCGGVKRQTLADVKVFVKQKKGKCLSKEYKNVSTKMIFKCSKGHKWKATFHMIKRGNWCPTCYKENRRKSNS